MEIQWFYLEINKAYKSLQKLSNTSKGKLGNTLLCQHAAQGCHPNFAKHVKLKICDSYETGLSKEQA